MNFISLPLKCFSKCLNGSRFQSVWVNVLMVVDIMHAKYLNRYINDCIFHACKMFDKITQWLYMLSMKCILLNVSLVVALMHSKCLINFLNGFSSHACKVFDKVLSTAIDFMHVKCLVKCLNEWLKPFFFWFRNLGICLNMIIRTILC